MAPSRAPSRATASSCRAPASVEGEIFNKSLTIEQNVLFEGMARRLDVPVDPPSDVRAKGKTPTLVPIEPEVSAVVHQAG